MVLTFYPYKTMAEIERVKGHLCVLATNVIFGIFIPISKYLMRDYTSPLCLTLCRFIGATLLFWTASMFIKDNRVSLRDLAWFFFFALTGIALNQGVFIFALGLTSPVDASVILTATPFSALFVSVLLARDVVTRRKLFGICVGAAGAVWLLTSAAGAGNVGSGSLGGDLLVFFATVNAAVYFVTAKPFTLKYSPITIMKWMFLFATLMFLPFAKDAFFAEESVRNPLGFWEIGGLLYVVIAATFVAYLLQNMGIKRIRPTTVAMYIYVQPVVSSAVAIFVGQDTFSWTKLFASALVFLGVYIVTTSPRTHAQLEFAKAVEDEDIPHPDRHSAHHSLRG